MCIICSLALGIVAIVSATVIVVASYRCSTQRPHFISPIRKTSENGSIDLSETKKKDVVVSPKRSLRESAKPTCVFCDERRSRGRRGQLRRAGVQPAAAFRQEGRRPQPQPLRKLSKELTPSRSSWRLSTLALLYYNCLTSEKAVVIKMIARIDQEAG